MGRYLLDTHILIWWLSDADKLSQEVYDIIANTANQIYVSATSIWEIATKEALGKLKVDADLSQLIQENGFTELQVSAKHANTTKTLPLIHRDPFDRMLIAQAIEESLTLVSVDRYIGQYEGLVVRG